MKKILKDISIHFSLPSFLRGSRFAIGRYECTCLSDGRRQTPL